MLKFKFSFKSRFDPSFIKMPGQVEGFYDFFLILDKCTCNVKHYRIFALFTYLRSGDYHNTVYQGWVAQTLFKFKCQLKLNWHLKYTWN